MGSKEFAVEMTATKIGYVLKLGRLRREMTICQLAEASGVPEAEIIQIERGEYVDAIGPLAAIAFACDVELDFQLMDMRTPEIKP